VNVAIAIGVFCIIFVIVVWVHLWLYLTRDHRSRPSAPAAVPAEVQAQPQPAPRAAVGQPMTCIQHRWSDRRHRLKLTEDGLCSTGERIRFCLHCAVEKTEEQPLTEMEPR
jgi:hypothetical protein